MIKKWIRKLSTPIYLSILNGVLISIIVGANIYFQAFCIPTTWAIIVLSICLANTIAYPFLLKTKYASITSFVNGLTCCVFIYCVVFLEHMNLLGLAGILYGVGLIIFIPHFFLIQMIWKTLIMPINKSSRLFFIIAVSLSFLTAIYSGKRYKESINTIESFVKSDFEELERNFMTEKIVGMHFIYHTRFCEFDGWRPPKHEPFLVIGMWLNNHVDPLEVDLITRVNLYKKFFPEKKIKFDCSCGIQYSKNYHNDPIFK